MPAAAAAPPPVAPTPSPAAAPAARPAAPASRPAATPKAAPKPAPAARAPAPAPAAAPASKVNNPFDDSFADMEKFATPEEGDAPKPVPEGMPPKPEEELPPKPGKEAELEEQPKPGEEGKVGEEKLGPDGKPLTDKPGKASPWKLVESYKKTNAQLQQEIADLRAAHKPGELPKEAQARFQELETRNKELEEEIRHVNYSKSREFVETYQQPYEKAWRNALSDLKELVIANDDGTSRVATAQDMIALANMPLGEATSQAKAWFGDAFTDIMAHRRVIKELSEKQEAALADQRKNGSARDQQHAMESQAKQQAQAAERAKVWQQVNAEAVEKYDFLRPVEGEPERNERLEKATKFVDETFALNVANAKTQEERDQMIKRHSAIRNRAIGFSVLKHENKSLKAKLAELEKSLAEFQGSEPTRGEPRSSDGGEMAADTLEGAVAGLARLAS